MLCEKSLICAEKSRTSRDRRDHHFALAFSGVAPVPRPALRREEPACDRCQGAAREPVDGRTVGRVITKLEKLTGVARPAASLSTEAIAGPNHPQKFLVWIIRQVRRITASSPAKRSAAPQSIRPDIFRRLTKVPSKRSGVVVPLPDRAIANHSAGTEERLTKWGLMPFVSI